MRHGLYSCRVSTAQVNRDAFSWRVYSRINTSAVVLATSSVPTAAAVDAQLWARCCCSKFLIYAYTRRSLKDRSHLISSELNWTGLQCPVQFRRDEKRWERAVWIRLNSSIPPHLSRDFLYTARMLEIRWSLRPRRNAAYCEKYLCLSVCLSVSSHNSKTKRPN